MVLSKGQAVLPASESWEGEVPGLLWWTSKSKRTEHPAKILLPKGCALPRAQSGRLVAGASLPLDGSGLGLFVVLALHMGVFGHLACVF